MRYSVIAEADLDAALDSRIRRMLCDCFPDAVGSFSQSRSWHGSFPCWSVIAEDEHANICGHVGIVDRVIRIGLVEYRVGGIQNVAVAPQCRGMGLSAGLMEQARHAMMVNHLDAGLLFCNEPLVKVYKRCEWRLLEGAKVNCLDESGRAVTLPKGSLAMWLPVGKEQWPVGDIDLCGSDW